MMMMFVNYYYRLSINKHRCFFFVLINKLAKCSFCLFVVVLNSLLILVLVLLLLFSVYKSKNTNIREFASSPLTHRHPATIRVCFSTRDNCETSQRKLTSTKFQEHVWSLTLAHTHAHNLKRRKMYKHTYIDSHVTLLALGLSPCFEEPNEQTNKQNIKITEDNQTAQLASISTYKWLTDWRYDDDTHWVCANLIVWLVERRKE